MSPFIEEKVKAILLRTLSSNESAKASQQQIEQT